ncbi:MAG: MFS transporter [Patescibacteria group bacterium]
MSDDTKALPLGVKLIAFVLFLRTFGWGFVDPFFSIFVNGFSASYAGVGGLISIMNFASLIAMLPLMRLADKMKDTVIMRDAELLYVFAIMLYLLSAFTGKLPFLVAAFIFNGIALPLIIVGAETYIRKYTNPDSQTKSFAFYTATNYLGWILGMVIAAFTVQYYGLKWMFLFVLPSALVGLLILGRIRERGLRSMLWGIRKYFHNGHDLGAILADIKKLNSRTFFFLILSFFDGVIVMFSYISIPLFALTIDLNLGEVALLMAIMNLPFVFSFVISEMTDRMKSMNVIAVGLLVGGISFILLSILVAQLWVAVLVTMTSVSLAIMRPAYNGMLTRLTPRRMLGEITSINNIALRMGYVVGPVLTGLIADRYSIQAAFFAIAIFAFALTALTLSFKGFEALQTEI